jgi:hypothetical protein
MTSADLLADAFGRVAELVGAVVRGLPPELLEERIDERANSVCWLVWHLTRIQDDHVAEVAGTPQAWTADGWARRFALPLDDDDTGYGHGPAQVAAVRVPAELLLGYHDAVYRRTAAYVRGLVDADLDRVVDERWDPPVTLGVRLVSVIGDDLQHAGQAMFLRGVLERRAAS